MNEMTVTELKAKLDNGDDFVLIDVREEYEFDIANIGGKLIPLGSIMEQAETLPRDKPVVIHCRTGGRSATACMQLERSFGFDNLYNLKGGITAWSDTIDPSVPKY